MKERSRTTESAYILTGPATLEGEISIDGAKNATLPCLVASLLTDEPLHLYNVPDVVDVRTLLEILESIGVKVFRMEEGIRVQCETLMNQEPPQDLVQKMRASFLLLGPLSARFGRARMAFPGGCQIGPRPVNFHIDGLIALGFQVNCDEKGVTVSGKPAKQSEYTFPNVSVTGTEHLILTAGLIQGEVVLKNCALEPEVVQLCELLVSMGVDIDGIGTKTLRIRGKKYLRGSRLTIIPDRIETGTYVIGTVLTRGKTRLRKTEMHFIQALTEKLEAYHVDLYKESDALVVDATNAVFDHPDTVVTEPYSGFPTDLRAQYMVLMTQLEGKSTIQENVFPFRFNHVYELRRMGAHIDVDPPRASVYGPANLYGATVRATDLRASASLVLAGLIATGTTRIIDIHHLIRGYARMVEKLQALKVHIRMEPADLTLQPRFSSVHTS